MFLDESSIDSFNLVGLKAKYIILKRVNEKYQNTTEWHKSFYGLLEIPLHGISFFRWHFLHSKNGLDKMMDLQKSFFFFFLGKSVKK